MAAHAGNGADPDMLQRSISLRNEDSSPAPSDLLAIMQRLGITKQTQLALHLDGTDYPDGQVLDHKDRVFVTRSLNMNTIKYIGFDMDYTLAIYKSPVYEEMAYHLIMQRLVDIGYPKELKDIKYDATFPQRGLFFDKEYGNLLKLDQYGNLLLCIHGFEDVDTATVRQIYPSKFATPSEQRYYCLNTLFNLPEVYILACLVKFYDSHPDFKKLHNGTGVESEDLLLPYSSIFQDVRMSVDWIHIEGGLKTKTISNLEEYIEKDARLPLMMHQIREAGRKVFLITNSGWEYTKHVMEYLFSFPHGPEPGTPHRPWTSYFDYVVVDAKKPLFFETGTALRQLDPVSGALKMGKFKGTVRDGETSFWAGGSSDSFCQITGARGKEILFVGDHIFGDILRSKKRQGWRTFLVVPELNQEIRDWQRAQPIFNDLRSLEFILSRMCHLPGEADVCEADIERLRHEIKSTALNMDACHRSRLGSLFRSGSRQSYFAMQAMRYADLYSSNFINLMTYPQRYLFRAPHQLMPHEQSLPIGLEILGTRSAAGSISSAAYHHDEDDEESDGSHCSVIEEGDAES